ncbi:MAG: 4Fe-4S binding protein [Tissierellia bacterium]|nr:4Fe-4S binding protein [Tissierellia bacterium]
MLRKIIKIDEDKCNGCGICVKACHEGAIGMVDGKAKLLRDDYCDGLGDCLPTCPTEAISFEIREALPFDEEAVKKNMAKKSGCPGTAVKSFERTENAQGGCSGSAAKSFSKDNNSRLNRISELRNWPIQIKLAPIRAQFFDNAHLLIAADCTAFSYANFHEEFMRNKITIIGCPKLDQVDYAEKLTEIIKQNSIESVTILKMEVPCCTGIFNMTKKALIDSGKFIPWQVVTISTDGRILE